MAASGVAAPLGVPRYAPRPSTNALKRIVDDHLEDLKRVYDDRFVRDHGPLSRRVVDLFERFTRCGDPHFGFLRLRCEGCGAERLLPFSCKARGLCPSCGKRRALAWAERIVEEVLPVVPYVPLVFTIPKILRRALLFDRRLYGELCRGAYAVVRAGLENRFPSLDRPVPAFLASPQSFGTLLNFHPHVHGLVSAGVFDREGEFHEDLDLDFASLELTFRDAVLERFVRCGRLDEERAALIRSWPHSGFQVHAEPIVPAASRSALESLLQYFERAPVSLKRITLLDTGMVLYQGRHHPGLGRDHQLVTGLEFLALLVPHIQLRYECKARLYGALSTTFRKRVGWIADRGSGPEAAPLEEPESDSTRARRRGWAQLIRKVWLDDPEICPGCGGAFKVVAALTSPAQDDIIRAILEARGEWAPPWQGRAPPAGTTTDFHERDDRVVQIEIDPDRIWPEE